MKKVLTNKYILILIIILLLGLSVGIVILTNNKKEASTIEENNQTDIKSGQNNNNANEDEKISEKENKDEVANTISDKNAVDKNPNNNSNSNNSETSSSKNNNSNENKDKIDNNQQPSNKDSSVSQPTVSPKPSVSPTPTPTVTPKPSNNPTPTPSNSPIPKTQAEKNDEYRKQIQEKYSITIAYKDELGDYTMSGYSKPVKQMNDDTIYSYLQKIENALKKYPTNFFKEIKNTRMNLTIYMVESISPGVAGLTSSSNRSNVILMINTIAITSFETTLHHEIMHFIDSYISFNLGSGVIESSMIPVNPSGFVYGNTDSSYVYDYYNTATTNTSYFLSNYSKTNYLEDRAVIFASLMTSTIKYSYLNKGTPIYNKAQLISNQLRDNFNSVKNSSNVYWERLLK